MGNVLVRAGKRAPWSTLEELLSTQPVGLAAASNLDTKAPETDFQESTSAKAEIDAGTVKVLVAWGTAQKEGEDVNHIDLHLQGLQDVGMPMGGLLAGEIS